MLKDHRYVTTALRGAPVNLSASDDSRFYHAVAVESGLWVLLKQRSSGQKPCTRINAKSDDLPHHSRIPQLLQQNIMDIRRTLKLFDIVTV